MQNVGWCVGIENSCISTARTVELDTIFEPVLYTIQSDIVEKKNPIFDRNIDFIYCSEKNFVNKTLEEDLADINHQFNDIVYKAVTVDNEDSIDINEFNKSQNETSCHPKVVVSLTEVGEPSEHDFVKYQFNVIIEINYTDELANNLGRINGSYIITIDTKNITLTKLGEKKNYVKFILVADKEAKFYKDNDFEIIKTIVQVLIDKIKADKIAADKKEAESLQEGQIIGIESIKEDSVSDNSVYPKLTFEEIGDKLKTIPIVRIPMLKL